MIASRHLEVRFVTLFMLLSPVVTLAVAWVLLGETPTDRALMGGAVMMLGIAIPVISVVARPSTRGEAQD